LQLQLSLCCLTHPSLPHPDCSTPDTLKTNMGLLPSLTISLGCVASLAPRPLALDGSVDLLN
jgi:hypothetical protein